MLIGYALSYAFIYSLFYFGWEKKREKKSIENHYEIKDISVIIPFRNEVDNLLNLKESILQLSETPLEFIWINDHSEDNSLSILKNLPNNQKIISLTSNEKGKKTAIRKGIELAQGDYILTWDADIIIPSNYFTILRTQKKTDLCILPVRMRGSRPIEFLYELDYYFLNSINASLSSYTDPIVASGANLLFKKLTFKEIDSFENHRNIASGDDIFLLHDFKKNKKSIQLLLNRELIVETHTPTTLLAFFQQRLRWISKSTNVTDRTTNLINVLGIIYLLGFIYNLLFSSLLITIMYKIILDILILYPYLTLTNRKKIIWFTPLFSLLYPFYFSTICIGILFFKNQKWKGRK